MMPHLPGNFNSRTLTQPNEIDFTCTTHGIPGCTAHSVDHVQNSWAYSQQPCNHHMSDLYFVLKNSGYGVTFAHVLTYFSNLHALSKMACKEQDQAVLQYSGVSKIRESKALLVHNCSKRLEEYGLTLWVVSIVLYIQESQA